MDLIFGSNPGLTASAFKKQELVKEVLEKEVDGIVGQESEQVEADGLENTMEDRQTAKNEIGDGDGDGDGDGALSEKDKLGMDELRTMISNSFSGYFSHDGSEFDDGMMTDEQMENLAMYGDPSGKQAYDDDDDDDDYSDVDRARSISSSSGIKIEEVIATYNSWLATKKEEKVLEETKQFVVFCDLDGVLVDFEAGVQKLFKKKKTSGMSSRYLILSICFPSYQILSN